MPVTLFTDTLTQVPPETDADFSLRVQQYVSDQQYYFEQAGGSLPVTPQGAIGFPPGSPQAVMTSNIVWDPVANQLVRQVTFVYDNTYYYKFLGITPVIPPPSPLSSNGEVAMFDNGAKLVSTGMVVDTVGATLDANSIRFTSAADGIDPQDLATVSQITDFTRKIKAQRISTGPIAALSSGLVTVTWADPFPTSDYTVSASVQDSTGATASLSVVHVEGITDTAVAVRVQNTSGGDLTGTLHVIAVHD